MFASHLLQLVVFICHFPFSLGHMFFAFFLYHDCLLLVEFWRDVAERKYVGAMTRNKFTCIVEVIVSFAILVVL